VRIQHAAEGEAERKKEEATAERKRKAEQSQQWEENRDDRVAGESLRTMILAVLSSRTFLFDSILTQLFLFLFSPPIIFSRLAIFPEGIQEEEEERQCLGIERENLSISTFNLQPEILE